jgi:bacteriocin biosynthesis cyclodehydratase domain-containing protein
MQPLLLPGTHVVRRGPDEIQAGLARDAAVTLGRAPARLDVLHADGGVMRTLRRGGLLIDDDRPLRTALPAEGAGSPWVRHTLAALARRAPHRLESSLRSRSKHLVTVSPFGHPISRELADDVEELCRRAGLRLPGPRRPGPTPRTAVQPQPVHVLVGVGEPTRDLLDDRVRESVPHLVVRLVEGRAVVGPFVVPGRTACLRCTDAYLTEEDPAWPLLVQQYARSTRSDRSDGIPEPVDAALAAVAVGRAARDLAAFTEGERPVSWSATTTISADLAEITTTHWPPHPHCGCAWG